MVSRRAPLANSDCIILGGSRAAVSQKMRSKESAELRIPWTMIGIQGGVQSQPVWCDRILPCSIPSRPIPSHPVPSHSISFPSSFHPILSHPIPSPSHPLSIPFLSHPVPSHSIFFPSPFHPIPSHRILQERGLNSLQILSHLICAHRISQHPEIESAFYKASATTW